MPSKITSGFKLRKNIDKSLGRKVKAQIRSYAISSFQRPLQKIVNPFHNDIYIETVTKTTGDVFTATVQARKGIETVSRVSNKPIDSADVFKFLNDGTKERWIGVPKDYQRASSPNSLITRFVENEQSKNYFLPSPTEGIAARNWTRLLAIEREPYTKKLFDRIIKQLASQFVSRG